jgi:hypothetical protein
LEFILWDEFPSLIVPHWIPVSVTALFSVAPWIPCPKRFSLRTLLIATTLVAVGLGAISWALGHF